MRGDGTWAGEASVKGMTRRRFAMLLSVGALAVLAGRIAWVNTSAVSMTPVESHEMGAWVGLDGAFLQSRLSESTQGYAVRVRAAEVMSRDAYVGQYATDESAVLEGLDVVSLVCLTLGIRNSGSSVGGIALPAMYLIAPHRNEFLVPDTQLLLATEDNLRADVSGGMGVSVRAGTEYEFHLAYRHQGADVEVNGAEVNEAYLRTVEEGVYSLRVSNLPVRHEIEVMVNA